MKKNSRNPEFNKEDILEGAIDFINKKGVAALSARSLAKELGCSTQPIFTNFESMESLLDAVIEWSYGTQQKMREEEAANGDIPTYKAIGLTYIRFAFEYPELFRLLYATDKNKRGNEEFQEAVDVVKNQTGMGQNDASKLQRSMWVFVHGIATMIMDNHDAFTWDEISQMLTEAYRALSKYYMEVENEGSGDNKFD